MPREVHEKQDPTTSNLREAYSPVSPMEQHPGQWQDHSPNDEQSNTVSPISDGNDWRQGLLKTDNQQQRTFSVEHRQSSQGFGGTENYQAQEADDSLFGSTADSWLPENTFKSAYTSPEQPSSRRGFGGPENYQDSVYNPSAYSPFPENAFTSPNQHRVEVNPTNKADNVAAKLSSLSFGSQRSNGSSEVNRNLQPEQETSAERRETLDWYQRQIQAIKNSPPQETSGYIDHIIKEWNDYQSESKGEGVRVVKKFNTLESQVQAEMDKIEGNVKPLTRSLSFKKGDDRALMDATFSSQWENLDQTVRSPEELQRYLLQNHPDSVPHPQAGRRPKRDRDR